MLLTALSYIEVITTQYSIKLINESKKIWKWQAGQQMMSKAHGAADAVKDATGMNK